MKKLKQGFIVPMLLGIIILLMAGGGIYIYNQKKSIPTTQQEKVNISTDLDITGKTYVNSCLSGEKGIFKSDGTVDVVFGLDYAGPTDTRPNHRIDNWKIKNNKLTITSSNSFAEEITLQPILVSGGTLFIDEATTSGGCGFIIGNSIDTIAPYLNDSKETDFFKNMKANNY